MVAKKSSKRRALQKVPQNLEEATQAVARLGAIRRQIDGMSRVAEAEKSKVDEELVIKTAPLIEEHDEVLDGIHAFAESNRKNLTKDEKVKTVKLATGTFSWRFTPWKVNIKNTEEVIATLKKLKLKRFIRTKEEPDKEAMLKEKKVAEGVEGVSITKREEFVVRPNETEVEVVKKLALKRDEDT